MSADAARRLRLLVEDFDDAAPAAASPPACTCERCRTEPDLPLCRAGAFEAGRRAGADARVAAGDAEAARAAALAATLSAALGAADALLDDLAETTAEALGGAVIAMVRAALPSACARLGAAEAHRLAAAVLPGLARQPALVIEAPEDATGALATALANMPPPLRARATITPADTLRIAWSAGQVRHDPADRLAGIDDLLGQFGLLPAIPPVPAREEAISHG